MTEKSIIHGLTDFQKKTYGNQNELFFQEDWTGDDKKGGTRLFVYDDKDSGENQETYHYMLVVEIPKDKAPAQSELREMQERLRKKLILKESPVYLLGKVKMDTPKKARPHAKSRY